MMLLMMKLCAKESVDTGNIGVKIAKIKGEILIVTVDVKQQWQRQ